MRQFELVTLQIFSDICSFFSSCAFILYLASARLSFLDHFFHCPAGPCPLEILHIHHTSHHLRCFKRIRFDCLRFGCFGAGSASQVPYPIYVIPLVVIFFESHSLSIFHPLSFSIFSKSEKKNRCGRARASPEPHLLTQSCSLTVQLLFGNGQSHIKP